VSQSFPRLHGQRRHLALAAALLTALLMSVAAGVPSIRRAEAAAPAAPASGYWLVASDGGLFSFGDAAFHGSTGAVKLNRPIVGMAPTASGKGYWLVASDGGLFAFGDAGFFGSTGAVKLNRPIVGMAPTASGKGYWLVASDGGLFAFGDAGFFGSTGAVKLNKPIVGMAPTASGNGYWLVASDGGLFSFGDAGFFGSGQPSGKTIVALTPTVTGRGYWQAAATGEVLAFGDAADLGSARVNVPVVGMARTASGGGYWLVAGDGGIFSFGDALFLGSTGGTRLNQPIVGLGVPSLARATKPPKNGPAPVDPGPGSPGPTPPPADPADPPPTEYGMEQISPPMESPNGGDHTADLPTSGTTCGFPSAPQRTQLDEKNRDVGEASGMVASARYPGVYWMIRDSANPPRTAVYAVRFDSSGNVTTREIPIPGAFNGDWEEINYSVGPDGKGHLWIVESGQPTSTGIYTDIYEVLEPDPDTATEAQLLNKYHYAFPDSSHNTEASFIHRGYLVLVAKMTPHARLYRFESLTAGDGVTNVPTYIGELGNSKDVSVVRQSPDGKMLITSSHTVVHLYRSKDGSGSLKSFLGRLPDCELMAFPDTPSDPGGGHVESGEFSSNREMVFLDELKKSYRLPLAP
jgi:hypothetical protein